VEGEVGALLKSPGRSRTVKELPGTGPTAKESPAVIMKSEVSLIASTAHDQKYIVKKVVTKKNPERYTGRYIQNITFSRS
jgi:hypothetical protein